AAALFVVAAVSDYMLEGRNIDNLASTAQRATADQDHEGAMKAALQGLPVDGDFFWRRDWSDTRVKRLVAILGGASQMSAYVWQLREKDTVENAAFDAAGST